MKKEVFNTIWISSEKILRLFSSLFVTAIVARHLGPESFGALNYAYSIVFILGVFTTYGIETVTIRELVKQKYNTGTILGSAIILRLLLAILCYIVLVFTADFLSAKTTQSNTLLFAALWFFGSPFYIFDQYYQSISKSKTTAIANLFSLMLFSALKILGVYLDFNLSYYALLFGTEYVFCSLLFYISFLRTKIKLHFSFDFFKLLLMQGFPLVFSGLMILLYMKLDQIMIANLSSKYELGLYATAVKLSEAWYFLPAAIVASFLPKIINSETLILKHARIESITAALVFMAVSAIAVAAIFARPAIHILFGVDYIGSVPILQLHMICSIFVVFGMITQALLIAEGHIFRVTFRSLLGLTTNLLLNLLLIPNYGGIGAALATIASQFAANFLFDLFDLKEWPNFIPRLKGLLVVKGLKHMKTNFSQINNDTL